MRDILDSVLTAALPELEGLWTAMDIDRWLPGPYITWEEVNPQLDIYHYLTTHWQGAHPCIHACSRTNVIRYTTLQDSGLCTIRYFTLQHTWTFRLDTQHPLCTAQPLNPRAQRFLPWVREDPVPTHSDTSDLLRTHFTPGLAPHLELETTLALQHAIGEGIEDPKHLQTPLVIHKITRTERQLPQEGPEKYNLYTNTNTQTCFLCNDEHRAEGTIHHTAPTKLRLYCPRAKKYAFRHLPRDFADRLFLKTPTTYTQTPPQTSPWHPPYPKAKPPSRG
jgi:hypothetical protein